MDNTLLSAFDDIERKRGTKYKLIRLNDGLVKYGTNIVWINYKLTGNAKYKNIAKGRGLVIYRGMADYWQTTKVQSYTKQDDGTILFTTENSNYKLEQLI